MSSNKTATSAPAAFNATPATPALDPAIVAAIAAAVIQAQAQPAQPAQAPKSDGRRTRVWTAEQKKKAADTKAANKAAKAAQAAPATATPATQAPATAPQALIEWRFPTRNTKSPAYLYLAIAKEDKPDSEWGRGVRTLADARALHEALGQFLAQNQEAPKR